MVEFIWNLSSFRKKQKHLGSSMVDFIWTLSSFHKKQKHRNNMAEFIPLYSDFTLCNYILTALPYYSLLVRIPDVEKCLVSHPIQFYKC
jgi:hypothetical protein